jgi:hypothetical protein
MKKTAIKIAFCVLTFCFINSFSFGQTIKENGKNIHLDPDTKMKLTILVDSLTGEWELIKTVCVTSDDTVSEEIIGAPMGTTSPKRPTIINFDTLQTFTISQWCMKCPLINWSGHYTLEIKKLEGFELFYLTFIEQRDKALKKNQKSFTREFNSYFTNLENGTLQLTDNKGCDWIYKRKTK